MTDNQPGETTNQSAAANMPQASTPAHAPRWLTLKEASDFLGIHFTTLRAWADRGEVPTFRTPGGHRRFSADDLRRFLEERSAHNEPPNAAAVVETALVRVRASLESTAGEPAGWRDGMTREGNDARRQRGRQLFGLALAYVLKPAQRERTLAEGKRLGWEYGSEAAQSGISLAETGRAVQFFRGQLMQAVRSSEATVPDADDLRVEKWIDHFLDEVLYAVLEGYDAALRQEPPLLP
jgi:excisionase family DNA binding protein